MALTSGCGDLYRSRLSHRTVPHPSANENTNGLLRQYLPKGSPLAGLDQSELDLVAASLNDRPRKTLDYATPNEAFNSLLAKLVSGGKTPNGSAVRYGV